MKVRNFASCAKVSVASPPNDLQMARSLGKIMSSPSQWLIIQPASCVITIRTPHSPKKYVYDFLYDNIPFCLILSNQASLPSSIAEKALDRDKGCIFTGVLPASNSDASVVATWIFPPVMGYTVSTNIMLCSDCALMVLYLVVVVVGQLYPERAKVYSRNIEALDISEFMAVTNTLSCRRDVATLFYENKLGIDVDVCNS